MIASHPLKILALSWKEPFASLMLHGKIETRTWKTNYRGLVLICASKIRYGKETLFKIAGNRQVFRMLETLDSTPYQNFNGKAIAIGRLIDCRPMTESDEDKCFVKYNPDLYCHVYEDVRAIEPFDWKGSQGWSKVTEEYKQKIKIVK